MNRTRRLQDALPDVYAGGVDGLLGDDGFVPPRDAYDFVLAADAADAAEDAEDAGNDVPDLADEDAQAEENTATVEADNKFTADLTAKLATLALPYEMTPEAGMMTPDERRVTLPRLVQRVAFELYGLSQQATGIWPQQIEVISHARLQIRMGNIAAHLADRKGEELRRDTVRGLVLAHHMGAGKTLSTVMLIAAGVAATPDLNTADADFDLSDVAPPEGLSNGKALIFVKPLLIPQWEAALMSFSAVFQGRVTTLHSAKHVRSMTPYTDNTLVVIASASMLSVKEDGKGIGWALRNKAADMEARKNRRPPPQPTTWETLVFDEAHEGVGSSSPTNASANARRIAAQYRVPVTATPMQNSTTEPWMLLLLLDIKRPKLSEEDDKALLAKHVANHVLRSEQAADGLPELTYQNVEVRASDSNVNTILEMLADNSPTSVAISPMAIAQLRRQVLVAPRIIHLSQSKEVTAWRRAHPRLARVADLPEYGPIVRELVDHLKADRKKGKVIVFTHYRAEVDALIVALSEVEIAYAKVVGDDSDVVKALNLEAFKSDLSRRVLIANIACGGAGLNLQQASTVYFMISDYNPLKEMQAIARMHRPGQLNKCRTVFFRLEGDELDSSIQELQYRKLTACLDVMGHNAALQRHTQRLPQGAGSVKKQRVDRVDLAERDGSSAAERAAGGRASSSAAASPANASGARSDAEGPEEEGDADATDDDDNDVDATSPPPAPVKARGTSSRVTRSTTAAPRPRKAVDPAKQLERNKRARELRAAKKAGGVGLRQEF